MSPPDPAPRTLVVVLQSRQPLTTDLNEAFPPDRFEVLVVTGGDPDTVLREDAPGPRPRTLPLPRDGWEAEIARWALERPVEIVTNDEYCVADCAGLRARLGMPARHPDEPVAYLDKVVMKRRLRAGGVPVPRFRAFEPEVPSPAGEVRRITQEVGLPAVAKPRREANSRGVQILRTAAEVRDWLALHQGEPGWQIEEYVAGSLHHANALVRHGGLEPVQLGTYLGPLLDLENQVCFGGFTLPRDHPLTATAHALNRRVVETLGDTGAFVVHTEFVVTPEGAPVVLEVAARAPGALVSETAQLHAGLNLEVANLRLQAGLPVPAPDQRPLLAAWLWLPVRPGERLTDVPELRGGHRLHVALAARRGNQGPAAAIGAALLLWDTDPAGLSEAIEFAHNAEWFRPMVVAGDHSAPKKGRTS